VWSVFVYVTRQSLKASFASQIYNRELKALLDNKLDDANLTSEMGERRAHSGKAGGGGEIGGKRERVKLEDLTRFTMVKRIW